MVTHEAWVIAKVQFTVQGVQRESSAAVTELDVLEGVKLWKQRRKPPLHVDEAEDGIRDLNALGWIDAQPSPNLPFHKKKERCSMPDRERTRTALSSAARERNP